MTLRASIKCIKGRPAALSYLFIQSPWSQKLSRGPDFVDRGPTLSVIDMDGTASSHVKIIWHDAVPDDSRRKRGENGLFATLADVAKRKLDESAQFRV